MALTFQTGYRLGRRGRVCRSYTGAQALGAILFELTFGLLFELTCLLTRQVFLLTFLALSLTLHVLRATFHLLAAICTAGAYLVTYPLKQFRRWTTGSDGAVHSMSQRKTMTKPEFAYGRDL